MSQPKKTSRLKKISMAQIDIDDALRGAMLTPPPDDTKPMKSKKVKKRKKKSRRKK